MCHNMEHIFKKYLPIRSAIKEPPSEPIAPPIKNIDTIKDHSRFIESSDKLIS